MQKAVERLNKNWPEETWTLTAGTISMGPSGQLTDSLEPALTRTATHIVRTFANRMRWTLIEPIGQFCPKSFGISCCPPGPVFRVYKCELRATLQHDAAFHFVQQLEQGQVIHLFQQSGLQLHWSETQTGAVQLKVQYESSCNGTYLEDDFLACLFQAYCSESSRQFTITHPGPLVPASIRLVNKCKVNFETPRAIQVSDLQSLWEMACRWVGRSPEIRWICGARNRTLTCPIGDCIHQGKIMFYHVVRLHGGGHKQDKVVETKTQLASWMALERIKVDDTMRIIETLHSKAGLPQLQHILGIQVADRWNALELLCRKVDEPLPVPHKGPPIPKTKPSKIVSSAPDSIQAAAIFLRPGYFITPDEQPAQVLRSVAPRATGVVLADFADVQSWLQNQTKISADALGLIIPGKRSANTVRQGVEVKVPVADAQQRQFLISATMYQLGEQEIGTASSSGDKVDTDGEDFAENIWSELLLNPVRITRRLLTEAGWNAGLSKVWGRAFLSNHVKVQSEKCDVIAFQATINSEDEGELLTHSGVAGPYITSRDPHGRPCNKYRVLWLPDSKSDLQVRAASMNAFGLVKSKTGLGIRVLADEYVKRYEALHPGKSAPAHVPVRFRYRLEQIPQGIQTTGLQSWATSLNWAIKIQKWNGPRNHWCRTSSSSRCPGDKWRAGNTA